jgi:hypothetical protein
MSFCSRDFPRFKWMRGLFVVEVGAGVTVAGGLAAGTAPSSACAIDPNASIAPPIFHPIPIFPHDFPISFSFARTSGEGNAEIRYRNTILG